MKLHTGKEIPDTIVVTIRVNLAQMGKKGFRASLAMSEARAMAKDPRYEIPDRDLKKMLMSHGILDRAGEMHDTVRAYILAVTKDAPHGDFRYVNPRTGK